MTMTQTNGSTSRKPLRLWPGVTAAVLLLLMKLLPAVAPKAELFGLDAAMAGIFGTLICAVAIVLWWLFFSRARWSERLAAVVVMILAIAATWPLLDISIQNGFMGRMFFVFAVPVTLPLALVAWAAASRHLSEGARRGAMVAAIAIGCGVWTLARTNGVFGGLPDLAWRWTPTAEERLLAKGREESVPPATPAPATDIAKEPTAATAGEKPAAPAASPSAAKTETAAPPPTEAAAAPAKRDPVSSRIEWPGFRGPRRDGNVRGVRIETDWTRTPPVAVWRRPVGPGWSSFAVSGDFIYTQEQRGENELVSCYRLSTGEPVWRHADAARFWESNGGAGPRGTPTLHNERVYSLGATGILNVLDAGNGAVVWSRNAVTDTGVEIPGWGIASSPLVVGDAVIVAVSGQLIAYDISNGDRRWLGPKGGAGYSSPHLVTIDGVAQVLLLRGSRTISVAPADGTLLWEHVWLPGASIVQPALTPDGDVLINTADAMGGQGFRRLAVKRGPAGWTVEERWTSRGLKPYFNDFVVHEGHAYGFDGNILACIDLENGERKWKGGRYGAGQMILLADQDLLLVSSEEGELALVSATPDKFTEVARVPALEGKTWNHPVLVGDVLLVRNGQEMAAFRLPRASR